MLAYEKIEGRSLDRARPERGLTDDVLAAIWRLLGRLREHGIAVSRPPAANIFVDDGGRGLIDFGFSEMAASDLLLATCMRRASPRRA